MALPIRPTPILTGKDAERLEAYMAESEYVKETIEPMQLNWDAINAAIERIRLRRKEFLTQKGLI